MTAKASPAPQRDPGDLAGDTDLGLDQIFEMLKNQRRRYVLQYLRKVDQQVTLGTLSEQIAAWENDKAVEQITSDERKRVYVGLYQVHLPKLDDADIVTFDKARDSIEPGSNIGLLYRYLDQPDRKTGRCWATDYVSLAAATGVFLLVAVAVQAIIPVPAVSVVAGVSLIAFATTALVHYRTKRADSPESANADLFGLATDKHKS